MISAVNNALSADAAPGGATTGGIRRRPHDGSAAALRALGRATGPTDPGKLESTATQMLSELLFKPLLAEMRKLPFGERFGHGGRAESIFAEQLDQRLADAASESNPGGLVNQFAKWLSSGPDGARTALNQALSSAKPTPEMTEAALP